MKRIYAGLTIICVLGALLALTGASQMIKQSPGLDLFGAFQTILVSGDAIPGLVVAILALIGLFFAKQLRDEKIGLWVRILAWIAALVPLGLAGWKIYRVLDIMRLIQEKAGKLALRILAPGYAEILLIAACAALGAGLAFGVLKIMAKPGKGKI